MQDFKEVKVLGSGSYGRVVLLHNNETGEEFARKEQLQPGVHLSNWVNEVKSLERLGRHPNIVEMYGHSLDINQICHIDLQYCANGDLMTLLRERRRLPAEIARKFFLDILRGLQHVHNSNIVHRDIKPQNILIDKNWRCNHTDFGSALGSATYSVSYGMSLPFIPPELWERRQNVDGRAVDMFAVGVVLYMMAYGHQPFKTARRNVDNHYTRMCDLANSSANQDQFGSLQHLLFGMLTYNPIHRFTLEAAMDHPWTNGSVMNATDIASYFD